MAALLPFPALQVLQRMLGERYMYHKKTGKGDDPSDYRPYYIDMSEWGQAERTHWKCIGASVVLSTASSSTAAFAVLICFCQLPSQ